MNHCHQLDEWYSPNISLLHYGFRNCSWSGWIYEENAREDHQVNCYEEDEVTHYCTNSRSAWSISANVDCIFYAQLWDWNKTTLWTMDFKEGRMNREEEKGVMIGLSFENVSWSLYMQLWFNSCPEPWYVCERVDWNQDEKLKEVDDAQNSPHLQNL